MTRNLVILYLLEAGLILIVLPWTRFWDRNYFMGINQYLEMALTNPILRGVVSGVGIVSFSAGALEIVTLLIRRRTVQFATPINSILDKSARLSP